MQDPGARCIEAFIVRVLLPRRLGRPRQLVNWQVPSVVGRPWLVAFSVLLRPRWHFETEETKSSKSRNNETWYRSVQLRTSLLPRVFTTTTTTTLPPRQHRPCYCAHVGTAYLTAYNYRPWKTHPRPDGLLFLSPLFPRFIESTF